MTIPIVLLFVAITTLAVINFARKNNKDFDRKFGNIFDSRSYVKLTMLNGEEDVYEFRDTQQMLAFIKEAKQHMALWIPADYRVKSYELLKRSEYMDYKNESEEISDE